MFTSRLTRLVALAAALTLIVALPAGASAATKKKALPAKMATLNGSVIGEPYQAGSRVLTPVLLQASSAAKAKLKAPLAMVSLPRTAKASAPKGVKVPVLKLRSGDVFSLRVKVTQALRKAAVPQFSVSKLTLTRRGTQKSAAELQEQLDVLNATVGRLAGYTLGQLADLRTLLGLHKADLTSLTTLVNQLRGSIPGLPADQSALVTSMLEKITQLQTQVTGLVGQLGGIDLAKISSVLAGLNPGDLTTALANVATLQGLVGGLNVGNLNTALAALQGQVGAANLPGITSSLATLQGTISGLTGQVGFLCGSAALVTGNPLLGILGLSNLTSCP